MPRHFNTAGPCQPDIHYMLPALRRIPQVRDLIDQRAYFVVHAPRLVGDIRLSPDWNQHV